MSRTRMMARRSQRPKRGAVAADLRALLSDSELEATLSAALLALGPAELERVATNLGDDTGEVLRATIARRGARRPVAASATRVRQDWDRAWSAWDECIAASGDEHGRFVVQDKEWEAPYLATEMLSGELDQVAEQIRPLLARVLADDLDSGFSFSSVIRDAADSIGAGLPEWMDGSWDDFAFGPEVTWCLLDGELAAARRSRVRPFDYLTSILELDESLHDAGLDAKTIERYMCTLPRSARLEIAEGIRANRGVDPWARALSRRGGFWARIARVVTRASTRRPARNRR